MAQVHIKGGVTVESGSRFGRLVVVSEASRIGTDRAYLCRCDCGTERVVNVYPLVRGHTKTCGCRKSHRSSRGYRCTYAIWQQMRARCRYEKHPFYQYYGGRGITVCEHWQRFGNFLADMGERPEGMTLDRIDNDGPYSKENCRWATRKEQMRNRRMTTYVEFEGVKCTLKDLAERFSIDYYLLSNRIRRGWSVERALREPANPIFNRYASASHV